MPHLTVLLPARNAAATIATAVSSTLRALPADAVLHVLDDGSTDATAERALAAGTRKGVVDPRLRVDSRPGAGGLAHALNGMLAETDSAVVARMDADDITLPWRFATSLPALRRGTDVVFTQIMRSTGRTLVPGAPLGIGPQAFPLHLLLTNPVSHPTMVGRREALERVGNYRAVPAEDYDLWLRLAAAGVGLRRLPLSALIYRHHPQQITADPEWARRSWHDPLQAEAFADLSEQLTGARLPRLVTLAHLAPEERESALQTFRERLLTAIDNAPPTARPLLRHRLRERSAWVRGYRPANIHGQGHGQGAAQK
ncbi:glycosyltransferase family 2 protein [Corynebacterium nasicanis]|uniref:Glycosyltransferase family 2 protein n=1 Tax=Corynebacterium nasicanis TaxID=1448267 RepID=A0ABW1QGH3_9CORY